LCPLKRTQKIACPCVPAGAGAIAQPRKARFFAALPQKMRYNANDWKRLNADALELSRIWLYNYSIWFYNTEVWKLWLTNIFDVKMTEFAGAPEGCRNPVILYRKRMESIIFFK
jgi:hypothetical protein